MSVAFTSNDTRSCPPEAYYIDHVTDGNASNATVDEADWSKVITINKTSGILSVTDTTHAVLWHIFLTASGKDGTTSGRSKT